MTEQEMIGLAYALALAVGIVVSGFVSSLWSMLSNEPLEFEMLGKNDLLVPVRVLVLVACAPTLLFTGAFGWMMERSPLSIGYFCLGVFWSFFQGVFIMTTLFNVT